MKLKLNSPAFIFLVIILIVVLVFAGWVVLAYNGLVAKQQSVDARWAQVENQYQRKIDLIPNLVAVTSQYTEFEQSVLQNITELRTRWQNATGIHQQINISEQIDQHIANIVVTYENYPYLQSIELVANLMYELSGTENRIAVERMRYNDAVLSYNTQIRSFPDNLVAGWFGFSSAEYYDPIPGGP